MRDLRTLAILEAALNLTETRAQAVQGIARAAAALVPGAGIVAWCVDGDGEPKDVSFERTDQRYPARFLAWQQSVPRPIHQRLAALPPRVIHVAADLQGAMMQGPFATCILANTGDGGGV